MYEDDERNRDTREYEVDNPGGYDPFGSPRRERQRSRADAERTRGGWGEDARSGRPGGYGPAGRERAGGRWTEDDVARTPRSRYNAYGPSDAGFEHGYAEAGHGSGHNAGFGHGDFDPLYEDAYRFHGPRDATRGRGIAGSGRPTPYGAVPDWDYGASRDHQYDRGFFEKAGDEIASWLGDEEAARRREMDHRGRGPSGYTRSDERIREDVCDRLTDDWAVDAREISVTVEGGEVTLDGSVDSRHAKRRAEDCVDRLSGVRHVQNNLRVKPRSEISIGTGGSGGDGQG